MVAPVAATPLFLASLRGHDKICSMLIRCGADANLASNVKVNRMEGYWRTPLAIATAKRYWSLVRILVVEGKADVCSMEYGRPPPLNPTVLQLFDGAFSDGAHDTQDPGHGAAHRQVVIAMYAYDADEYPENEGTRSFGVGDRFTLIQRFVGGWWWVESGVNEDGRDRARFYASDNSAPVNTPPPYARMPWWGHLEAIPLLAIPPGLC